MMTALFHIEKNKIRRYFYTASLSVIIVTTLLLSSIYIHSLEKELTAKIEQLSSSIINEKKLFLRNAVERSIFLIDNVREEVERENSQKNLTEQEIESISAKRIGGLLRRLRLVDNGYIWVNHILDYTGGDNYAVRLIHPNLPESEGMLLSTNMSDGYGNRPYETELNGINQKGELYFEYFFKKIGSAEVAHKLSFAKLYKPYDWVIATGIYLDDLDLLIETETQKMHQTHNKQKRRSFVIALLAVLISLVIMVLFEKRIRNLILSHEEKIEAYTKKLKMLSITDSLTGLYNRYQLDNVLLSELNRAQRYNKTFSIIMLDLDKFKQINDTYGHQAGDDVIQELAKILRDNIRSSDIAGRWGGEEFMIICPETELQGAQQFAEKIRKIIELHEFSAIDGMTSSFGVAAFRNGDDIDRIMKRADQALYRAKNNGRNRVLAEAV
ncbi:diguanylate cyclase [Psychromonas sp.]|uniref:sensor domain-containing diguanylate cyclase n=1 Tax=Psychromonas sp. TaxID=1884585 RepID=UPI003569EA23